MKIVLRAWACYHKCTGASVVKYLNTTTLLITEQNNQSRPSGNLNTSVFKYYLNQGIF